MITSSNKKSVIIFIFFERHTGKAGRMVWMHGRDAWTLEFWTTGRLGSGRLDVDSGNLYTWTLDAWSMNDWTLGLWTVGFWTIGRLVSKRLDFGLGLIFCDIFFFLIVIYCRIFKHFERSMTNVLWLC